MNVHEFGLCVCVYIISMKKGQVVSIGRTLPPECPFQTYADLQKHWNGMVYKHTHAYNSSRFGSYVLLFFKQT